MKVLLYWHDIYLPYSEYIIRAFDHCEDIDELIIGGPGDLETHEIFSSGSHSGNPYKKTKMIEFETYAIRPRWSKFSSFKNAVRDHAPDLVIVLDEAMSINVLYAGLANYITATFLPFLVIETGPDLTSSSTHPPYPLVFWDC